MTRPREQQFDVWLYDRVIGRLHRRENQTRFLFDPDYWQAPDRAVLGLRFEENRMARHQANMRLPPWFSNLLPEGRLREWIAHARHTSIDAEMELLAQVGHDLPGAVRVLPTDRPAPVEFADEPGETGADSPEASSLWRCSLAGVRLKFSLLARGDRLVLPAFGEGGDWIVKVPDSAYPSLAHNELAMMTLAAQAGIETPEVRLIHRDQVDLPTHLWQGRDAWAYAVRRFDRGPAREPIHIEDMAQVRGAYPDEKYQGSFEGIAKAIYRGHDTEALREFARRLAFCILIGNGDAHLKNWSLIYRNRRIPTLSPAYDLVSTCCYNPQGAMAEDLGLKFGSSRRFEAARLANFARLDERLGAKADLVDVCRMLVNHVNENWPQAAELLKGHPELTTEIGGMIRHRSAHLTNG